MVPDPKQPLLKRVVKSVFPVKTRRVVTTEEIDFGSNNEGTEDDVPPVVAVPQQPGLVKRILAPRVNWADDPSHQPKKYLSTDPRAIARALAQRVFKDDSRLMSSRIYIIIVFPMLIFLYIAASWLFTGRVRFPW